MVSVKHPTAGRVNLYKDSDDRWKVFDGLHSMDGAIEPDGFRSQILEQLQLAPHINEIISELNGNADPPRSERPLMVKDIDVFNSSYNDITHVPPSPNADEESLGGLLNLANNLLANDKQFFEVGLETRRPEASFLAKNPKAALAILNDLPNSTPTSIMQLMTSMFEHNYLSAGHADVPNNTETLFQRIDNRNTRAEKTGDGDGITGYERPTTIYGGLVPSKSMSFEEKDEYYRHFEDIYGRPKAWIQHTPQGQDTYDRELEDVKANFDWDGFVKGVLEDSFFAPSLANAEGKSWIPLENMLDSDGIFRDVGEELKVPLSELIPMLTDPVTYYDDINDPEDEDESDGETVRDRLSADQIAVIDKIMSSDDGSLAFGIVDRDEGLAKKFKNDTMDVLLGEPVRPTAEEWKLHEERGIDDGMMHIGNRLLPFDEIYKHRTGGLLQITGMDDDKNYRMVFRDGEEEIDAELPRFLSGTSKDKKTGEYGHVINFDDYLDQSVLDQFVRDGVLPQKYAPDIEAREGTPEAPDFGSDACIARVNFLSNKLRDFKTQMPRGYDNETGFFQYSLDPDNSEAQYMKLMDTKGNPKSIMTVLYDELNGTEELGIGKDQFIYLSDAVRAEADSVTERIADGESPPNTPNPPTDDRGATGEEPEEPLSSGGRLDKHLFDMAVANELQRRNNASTDEKMSQGYSVWGSSYQQNIDDAGTNFIDEDLLNSPHFQEYQETQRERQAHEVLASAPLDVRVTAYRMRIEGLQNRLEESTNMGEAYDIARDWFRIGAVEYPDIVQIDRDGTSKFKKVRDAIDNVGVDWFEVNEEWVQHGNTVREHGEALDALQEQINYLNETYPDMGDGDAEQEAAMRLKEKFEFDQRNLREKGTPEFGSQAHVDMLYDSDPKVKNDPVRLQAYADRENTPIGESDSITSTIRGTANSLTGALAAGLTTWRESRLYGLNPIAAGIHAAMSMIGEGTGIGADQIRGMDLSKPLEQMPVGYEDAGLRSYFSIGIPGTNVGKRETMYERNKREAGEQGQTYQPPQTATEEQEAALQRVQDTAGRRTIPTSAPADTMEPTPPPEPEPAQAPTGQPENNESTGTPSSGYRVRDKM
tara:strand:+ start:1712 stop:5017 length:3306 start_codon:yes stop_codon:yes gene_type:complete